MRDIYAHEKFADAIGSLVGLGTIQNRLLKAAMSFHPIQDEHFTNPRLAADYRKIMDMLTSDESDPDKGYLTTTLERMSDERAAKIANLIWNLTFDLMSEGAEP